MQNRILNLRILRINDTLPRVKNEIPTGLDIHPKTTQASTDSAPGSIADNRIADFLAGNDGSPGIIQLIASVNHHHQRVVNGLMVALYPREIPRLGKMEFPIHASC